MLQVNPANTRRRPNAVSMCLRRWHNIDQELGRRLVFFWVPGSTCHDGKSEFQVIVPRHYKDKFAALSRPCLRVGRTPVFPSQTVRDLGVTLDAEMSLSTHVGNIIICSMYMHMRHISRIRHHLDNTTLVKVVMALVISRLDYANSALYGVTIF